VQEFVGLVPLFPASSSAFQATKRSRGDRAILQTRSISGFLVEVFELRLAAENPMILSDISFAPRLLQNLLSLTRSQALVASPRFPFQSNRQQTDNFGIEKQVRNLHV
jgi:hypothetical protein